MISRAATEALEILFLSGEMLNLGERKNLKLGVYGFDVAKLG